METDNNTRNNPMALAAPEGEKAYVPIAQNFPPEVVGARFTLTDLANACRLARVDYPTFLRLRAYLPLSTKPPKNQ
jgi:hypothetical protein